MGYALVSCNNDDIMMTLYVHIWSCNHMMNTAVTCEWFCCPKLSTKLVFSIPSFGLNYSLYPSRHTLYQVLTYFLWYLLPLYLATLPKLLYTSRCHFILCQPPFQMLPEILMSADCAGHFITV